LPCPGPTPVARDAWTRRVPPIPGPTAGTSPPARPVRISASTSVGEVNDPGPTGPQHARHTARSRVLPRTGRSDVFRGGWRRAENSDTNTSRTPVKSRWEPWTAGHRMRRPPTRRCRSGAVCAGWQVLDSNQRRRKPAVLQTGNDQAASGPLTCAVFMIMAKPPLDHPVNIPRRVG